METCKGQFLLASVDLLDPNFAQTVVLMVEHHEQGALGLVMNRPTRTTMVEAWKQTTDGPCTHAGMLYQGGPCEGPLMCIHRQPAHSQIEICEGVHFTQDAASLAALMAEGLDPMRCFVGYSGWAPGQLDAEMEEGAWVTVPATWHTVFEPADRLWITLMRQIAPDQVHQLRATEIDQSDATWN